MSACEGVAGATAADTGCDTGGVAVRSLTVSRAPLAAASADLFLSMRGERRVPCVGADTGADACVDLDADAGVTAGGREELDGFDGCCAIFTSGGTAGAADTGSDAVAGIAGRLGTTVGGAFECI